VANSYKYWYDRADAIVNAALKVGVNNSRPQSASRYMQLAAERAQITKAMRVIRRAGLAIPTIMETRRTVLRAEMRQLRRSMGP
jgi:hypothetical protein